MRRLTVDLRMYRHSGIGRYLRNVIPLALPRVEADAIRVVTSAGLLEGEGWVRDARVEVVEVGPKVYSPGEQGLVFQGVYQGTDLLWVPHYNVPLAYRGRMVVTIYDLAPMALPETFSSGLKRWVACRLIRAATSRAAAIMTISQFTADELRARLGIAAEKITVAHPALDGGWPERAEGHREVDGVPYLLYVGNVKPNKNLKLLLGAFGKSLDRIPHRLVLAGRMRGFGTEDTDVLRMAEGLGDRVRWTGEIPDAELISLYAGADAFVMPSLYEGFGLPLLEAMQLGCPVLCSNAASLPEVGGDAALYFDPRDEGSLVKQLLRLGDAGLMDEMRRRGKARVGMFSYERCAEAVARVLNTAMREER